MSGYIGPLPVPQGIQRKQSFTATASQTTFNTNGYTDGNFINVYLNGVRLINGTDYTATNGSDIVLTTGASASDVLDFETFDTFSLVSETFENITTKNPTHEDTDGGRESALSFKGEQSGGEISTLAQIQASHDGTADDQKGDLIFKTNDGSDNDAPTEAMRIDSDQNILVGAGNTSSVNVGNGTGVIQIGDPSATPITALRYNNSSGGPFIMLGHSRSTTVGTVGTVVSDGDDLGTIRFNGDDGTDVDSVAAAIVAEVDGTPGSNDMPGRLKFETTADGASSTTERMRIDSSGLVTISGSLNLGTTADAASVSATASDYQLQLGAAQSTTGDIGRNISFDVSGTTTAAINSVDDGTSDAQALAFFTGNSSGISEAMRLTTTGVLRVGKTDGSVASTGFNVVHNDFFSYTNNSSDAGDRCLILNRQGDDGAHIEFKKANSAIGKIGTEGGGLYIGDSDVALYFDGADDDFRPFDTNTLSVRDNVIDIGHSNARFDDINATNATIQTSDEREKQQIASLTDAEITAAKAISKLFKTYKWNSSVESKGNNARIHTGVIAQQVETVMSDAGLDISKYAFYTSTTWWETTEEIAATSERVDEDGNVINPAKDAFTKTNIYNHAEDAPEGATERNRKGIRYPELLSFIGAATEQRLTSIEARLDALETE